MKISISLILLFAFLSSVPGHPQEVDDKQALIELNSTRQETIDAFFKLLSNVTQPDPANEEHVSAGLGGVIARLKNTQRFKNDPTRVASFIHSVGKQIITQEEQISRIVLYGPTDARKSNMIESANAGGNSFVAVANLKPESTESSLLIVFFEFAANSKNLLTAPVFVKADSSFSLYDLALRELDEDQR